MSTDVISFVPLKSLRTPCDVRKEPTASTRSASAGPIRRGPNGTPSTWWQRRQAKNCPCERLRRGCQRR